LVRAKIEVVRPLPDGDDANAAFARERFPSAPRSVPRSDAFAAVERHGPTLSAMEAAAAASLANRPRFSVPGFRSNPPAP
jgi:hypothetical protein